MISVGIDVGAQNIKVVLLKDDKEVLAQYSSLKGGEQEISPEEVLQTALKNSGLSRDNVQFITATGSGSKTIPHVTDTVTGIAASAKGAFFLFPAVKTLIDVGAEDARAMKCDGKGKTRDFVMNDKCAAGAGTFVATMARALEVDMEEFAQLSLRSTLSIPMNAQCVIFAESEVVSLIHAKTPAVDIAFAVHNAIAERVASLVQRVGIEEKVALIGGVAHNVGFVACMKKSLGVDILIPQGPEYVTALGAALVHN